MEGDATDYYVVTRLNQFFLEEDAKSATTINISDGTIQPTSEAALTLGFKDARVAIETLLHARSCTIYALS